MTWVPCLVCWNAASAAFLTLFIQLPRPARVIVHLSLRLLYLQQHYYSAAAPLLAARRHRRPRARAFAGTRLCRHAASVPMHSNWPAGDGTLGSPRRSGSGGLGGPANPPPRAEGSHSGGDASAGVQTTPRAPGLSSATVARRYRVPVTPKGEQSKTLVERARSYTDRWVLGLAGAAGVGMQAKGGGSARARAGLCLAWGGLWSSAAAQTACRPPAAARRPRRPPRAGTGSARARAVGGCARWRRWPRWCPPRAGCPPTAGARTWPATCWRGSRWGPWWCRRWVQLGLLWTAATCVRVRVEGERLPGAWRRRALPPPPGHRPPRRRPLAPGPAPVTCRE